MTAPVHPRASSFLRTCRNVLPPDTVKKPATISWYVATALPPREEQNFSFDTGREFLRFTAPCAQPPGPGRTKQPTARRHKTGTRPSVRPSVRLRQNFLPRNSAIFLVFSTTGRLFLQYENQPTATVRSVPSSSRRLGCPPTRVSCDPSPLLPVG